MKRFSVILLLMLLLTWNLQAQDDPMQHPIVYIGPDGNVLVTNLIETFSLTEDASVEQGIIYRQPRFSPDNSSIAVLRDGPDAAIILIAFGSDVTELVKNGTDFYIDSAVMAWSPDSSELAFFATGAGLSGLYRVRVADGQVNLITSAGAGCIGEAGGEDPALALAADESGNSPYREFYGVSWTGAGLLYSPVANCGGTGLVAPDGHVRWTRPEISAPVLEAEQPRFAALDDMTGTFVTASGIGDSVALSLPDDAKLLGVSGERVIYGTRTLIDSVTTDPAQTAGFDVYFENWSYFTAEKYTLTLWQAVPGQEPAKLFETEGYDFGVVYPAADEVLVFSVITSNFDAVQALNNGATADAVRTLVARPIIYVIEAGSLLFQFDGSQPHTHP